MRNLFSSIFLLLLIAANAYSQVIPAEAQWEQLFNGKDLSNWDVKFSGFDLNDNYKNTFQVKDGVLSVSYDEYETFNNEFGHIFYNRKFSYYIIGVEYRFVGDQVPDGPGWAFRNNGVMLHSQSARSMGKNQDFPYSIEVQLLGGNGSDERSTANLCTPGTNVVMDGKLFTPHCVNSSSKTFHGDQWVKSETVVLGDSLIQHYVNGELVIWYEKPQIGGGQVSGYEGAELKEGTLLVEGFIALQAESHPTQFRKIEIINLVGCTDPKATNHQTYFVKSDNSLCIYAKDEY